jgi:hypothetical protein
MKEIVLFAHPTFGVLGILAAVWLIVEVMNAKPENQVRIVYAAYTVAVCMSLTWLLAGYWYTIFYGPEKAVILAGPWPWAHNLVMETKEHLFFIPGILALLLPIVAAKVMAQNRAARLMIVVVAGLIVLNGLAIEGAGAIINAGAKAGFAQTAATVQKVAPAQGATKGAQP